jgi:hypothetical protein
MVNRKAPAGAVQLCRIYRTTLHLEEEHPAAGGTVPWFCCPHQSLFPCRRAPHFAESVPSAVSPRSLLDRSNIAGSIAVLIRGVDTGVPHSLRHDKADQVVLWVMGRLVVED